LQSFFAKLVCIMPEVTEHRKADRTAMRALAHPLRISMLEVLRQGPSTASRLARELGESTGATSYHLRVLARAGLIEHEPDRGRGRERWWRRREPVIMMPTNAEDSEGRALEAELRSIFTARDEEALRRFVALEPGLDARWRRDAFVGSWNAYVTPEEADELGRHVIELVDSLRRSPDARPADARRCLVTFRVLPWLESS
jgi:DNA-binding transcriptional ArsR family regulator